MAVCSLCGGRKLRDGQDKNSGGGDAAMERGCENFQRHGAHRQRAAERDETGVRTAGVADPGG